MTMVMRTGQWAHRLRIGGLALCLIGVPTGAFGATVYTDEATFLAAVADLGRTVQREGFEDDAVWGGTRTPDSQAPITSQGLTWTSNNDTSLLSSSLGGAHGGEWGAFSRPHGDFANTAKNCALPARCGDGMVVTSPVAFVAIGGWFQTNTPPAELQLTIDATVLDLPGESSKLSTEVRFLGVIEPKGFLRFEAFEVEGTAEDQKFIFFDSFAFATTDTSPPQDAGVTLDGTPGDASLADLGVDPADATSADATLDATSPVDSAVTDSTETAPADAGATNDSGSDGSNGDESGCSCITSGNSSPMGPLGLLLLGLVAIRLGRSTRHRKR